MRASVMNMCLRENYMWIHDGPSHIKCYSGVSLYYKWKHMFSIKSE